MLSQGRDQRTIRVTRVSEMKGICVTGGGGGVGFFFEHVPLVELMCLVFTKQIKLKRNLKQECLLAF